jgi:hypothetical protein
MHYHLWASAIGEAPQNAAAGKEHVAAVDLIVFTSVISDTAFNVSGILQTNCYFSVPKPLEQSIIIQSVFSTNTTKLSKDLQISCVNHFSVLITAKALRKGAIMHLCLFTVTINTHPAYFLIRQYRQNA